MSFSNLLLKGSKSITKKTILITGGCVFATGGLITALTLPFVISNCDCMDSLQDYFDSQSYNFTGLLNGINVSDLSESGWDYNGRSNRLINIDNPVDSGDASNKGYVDYVSEKLHVNITDECGEKMDDKLKEFNTSVFDSFVWDANDSIIKNVGYPMNLKDASTKEYVDVKFDTLNTSLFEGWDYDAKDNRIKNLAWPINKTDAVHKAYVDGDIQYLNGTLNGLNDTLEGLYDTMDGFFNTTIGLFNTVEGFNKTVVDTNNTVWEHKELLVNYVGLCIFYDLENTYIPIDSVVARRDVNPIPFVFKNTGYITIISDDGFSTTFQLSDISLPQKFKEPSGETITVLVSDTGMYVSASSSKFRFHRIGSFKDKC